MQDGRSFLSWHAADLVRDNPETREPGILIVTDRRNTPLLTQFYHDARTRARSATATHPVDEEMATDSNSRE